MFSIRCLKRHSSLMFIPLGLKETFYQAGIAIEYNNASDHVEPKFHNAVGSPTHICRSSTKRHPATKHDFSGTHFTPIWG